MKFPVAIGTWYGTERGKGRSIPNPSVCGQKSAEKDADSDNSRMSLAHKKERKESE